MSGATPLPRDGEVFFDDRGKDRALRLSWHPDAQVMVISIWNGGVCSGTFRLPARDVPVFMESLAQAMPSSPPRGRRHAAPEGRADAPAGSRPTPPGPDDGPGPTTQALDALKSLSSPAPAPPPAPPQQPYRQPPAAPHRPQPAADRYPPRPVQPSPSRQPGGGRFPVTGEYERRPRDYSEPPRRPR